ncbi:MAG TPA: hypothetical protein VJY62_09355 [Bacteroidia bacterium]|nr:hypothetical protein [Bacteroidia bacterium]
MRKKTKFLVLTILLIVGRIYDVYSTSIYTPDLAHETNIAVKYLGAGWTSVIALQLLVTGLVIFFLHYYFFKFKTIRPDESDLTLKQYISYSLFNDKNSFGKAFYKMPGNKSVLIATTGYITTMTLIAISYIVGTSTTILIMSEDYKRIYKMGIPYLLYCIIGMAAIYFTTRFFQIEYKRYKDGYALT